MNTTYEAIFNEWEAELSDTNRKVFQALKNAYPNKRTRRELIFDVYGLLIPRTVDLNNNKYDRKIRLSIASMQDDLIPIVSSSSRAGYCLDMNPDKIESMRKEFERRRAQYDHKINRANSLVLKLRYAREHILTEPVVKHVYQMELGEAA